MTATVVASTPLAPPAALAPDGHERVVITQDPDTGLRLLVAVHSTVLGPALGGLRLRSYAGGLHAALDDVLALARTMTFKAAAAGLDLGGGKAVVIDDGRMPPGSDLRAARLEAAGHAIDELGGVYVTAEDVGTTIEDMEAIARGTRFVVGRSPEAGGGGDPSPVTAATVLAAIWIALASPAAGAAASHALSPDSLTGARVGVVGLGKVGGVLADRLVSAGAEVLAFDVDPERLATAQKHGIEPASSLGHLLAAPLDVLAPCALGGLIDGEVASALRCRVVCGAANNPLATPAVATALAAREILYVPDFLANCGGLIHVAAEWEGTGAAGVQRLLTRAATQLERVLAEAAAEEVTPQAAAERVAVERLADASGLVA
jgi:glutamate dehydrogenase/leucine dehydrogenase